LGALRYPRRASKGPQCMMPSIFTCCACEAPAKNRTAQQYWQTKQRRAQCDARVFYPLPAWGIFALEMFRTLATQRPQVCRGGRRQDKTNNHENQTIYVCVYMPIRRVASRVLQQINLGLRVRVRVRVSVSRVAALSLLCTLQINS